MSTEPAPEAPAYTAFAERYFPRAVESPSVRELHRLLQEADPAAALPARQHWLGELLRWLRRPETGGEAAAAARQQASTARLRILVQVLREVAVWRARTARVLWSVLRETSGYAFFCETGTGRVGFLGEVVDRVARRLIPVPPDEHDLGELLGRLFAREEDDEWLEQVPSELVAELFQLLEEAGREPLFEGALASLREALSVVALRAAARGFADDLRARMPPGPPRESPFLALPRACDALLLAEKQGPLELRAAHAALQQVVGECKRQLGAVHGHLEQSGVSVDLVYRMELIAINLGRIEAAAGLLAADARAVPGSTARVALDLVVDLLRQRRESRSLRGLLRSSTHQMARKIVERAGHTGEHYITSSAAEHRQMFLSATGGGALTALCVALKFAASHAGLAPFFEAAAYSAIYGGGFLLMQLCGFTLATKQPSVTAAALAAAIKQTARKTDLGPLVEMVARMSRSQLAAVAGNLGVVVPAAFLLDALARAYRGASLLDEATSSYVLHSLHPTHSLTWPWAALTGFILWTGSLAGGWLENWFVYRRLPEAVARHRGLERALGRERAQRLAAFLGHHVSGLGSNLSLGVLLGCTPILGRFFGLPLDVRHVTFSTGAVALAVSALGPFRALEAGLLPALLGVVGVGALNLAVSFALALAVAFRARAVRRPQRLFGAVAGRLRATPRDFFWPPRAA